MRNPPNNREAENNRLPTGLWQAIRLPWTWRMAARDAHSESRRLLIFASSIIAGITALVGVHSLRDTLEVGIERQAKALLGSDLLISARAPFTPEETERFREFSEHFGEETNFSTLLSFPERDAARLVQIRGIHGGFPFYGEVKTDPEDAWERLHDGTGILLEPALLDQYDASIGDIVKVGDLEIPILGTLSQPPPRSGRFAGFAPEAYLRKDRVEQTGLLGTSSLARFYVHLLLPPDVEAEMVRREIEKAYPDKAWRYQTPESRREQLGEVLDQFEQFLGLIALVSLVLGAIGVASAIQAHVRRRRTSVAVLRCLGAPASLALAVYMVQAGLLGAAGTIIGGLCGTALHYGILTYFGDAFPFALDAWPDPMVVLRTTLAGFAVCCGFALIPLLGVRDIAPGKALRESMPEPRGIRRLRLRRTLPVYLLLGIVLSGLSVLSSASPMRALQLTLGLAVAFALLAGTARLLSRCARWLVRPSWPYLPRQGISNLYRPGNQTQLFLLSLGLGVFLLLSVLLVRNQLMDQIRVSEMQDGPNVYLVDVQADQLEGVREFLADLNLPVLEAVRMVTMRIASINSVSNRELRQDEDSPDRVLRREYRSTYRHTLNDTETGIRGSWPPENWEGGEPIPLSLEKGIAEDLGVDIGDRIGIDVQGIPLETEVRHIREVDWNRFNLNFFMIFPLGVLENAPGFHVVTTRIREGKTSGTLQRALVNDFPNVTAIDLTLILDTMRNILQRVSQAIQILAGFTIVAGLAILAGALLNGRDQRIRESVLLRTLGASSRQVRTILLYEYAALGLLSALTGTLLALGAHSLLALLIFKANPLFPWATILATPVVAVLISILAGTLLSRGVCTRPPLEILRRR